MAKRKSKETLQQLKSQISLQAVITKELGPSAIQSGRHWWPCPFHTEATPGGAFGLTPDGQGYKCFSCGATGDIITWTEDYYRLVRWREKFAKLRELAGLAVQETLQKPIARQPDSPHHSTPPPANWQARGRELAAVARKQWAEGQPGLDYLQAGGLTADIIQSMGLGWLPPNPRHRWGWYGDDPGRWGLGQKKRVWLCPGIVTPCETEGILWYIKIRHFSKDGEPTDKPKYLQPAGARTGLYGRWNGKPALLLTEGERDAMLAIQEIGDLVDVASFGGSTQVANGIPGRWLLHLLRYERIFAAYDSDAAGTEAVIDLVARSDRIERTFFPAGNDLTDFHIAGGDLRVWIKFYLCQLPTSANLLYRDPTHYRGTI